jgi:hypothetical protein
MIVWCYVRSKYPLNTPNHSKTLVMERKNGEDPFPCIPTVKVIEYTIVLQIVNYRKNCQQMMAFKGTVMLHKTVPQCRVIKS